MDAGLLVVERELCVLKIASYEISNILKIASYVVSVVLIFVRTCTDGIFTSYNEKEEKEMVFGIILFVTWMLFSWAYLSEMDEYLNGKDDED